MRCSTLFISNITRNNLWQLIFYNMKNQGQEDADDELLNTIRMNCSHSLFQFQMHVQVPWDIIIRRHSLLKQKLIQYYKHLRTAHFWQYHMTKKQRGNRCSREKNAIWYTVCMFPWDHWFAPKEAAFESSCIHQATSLFSNQKINPIFLIFGTKPCAAMASASSSFFDCNKKPIVRTWLYRSIRPAFQTKLIRSAWPDMFKSKLLITSLFKIVGSMTMIVSY